MKKVLLADNQAIFRAGLARVLSTDHDLRLAAQCEDQNRLMLAIVTYPSSVVIFASGILKGLDEVMAKMKAAGSVAVVIAEENEPTDRYGRAGVRGLIYRNTTGEAFLHCVRHVARGGTAIERSSTAVVRSQQDFAGVRLRETLTRKELQVVHLITQGYKNRQIADSLHTSEQVVKNYVRNVFDKVGVSDRLELAIFALNHEVLATAALAAAQPLLGTGAGVTGAVGTRPTAPVRAARTAKTERVPAVPFALPIPPELANFGAATTSATAAVSSL